MGHGIIVPYYGLILSKYFERVRVLPRGQNKAAVGFQP